MIHAFLFQLSTELSEFDLSSLHKTCCWALLIYHLTLRKSQNQFWDKIAFYVSRFSLLIPITVFTLNQVDASSGLLIPLVFFLGSVYLVFKHDGKWAILFASGLALQYFRNKEVSDSNSVSSLLIEMNVLLTKCQKLGIDEKTIYSLQKSLVNAEKLNETLYAHLTDLHILSKNNDLTTANIDTSFDYFELNAMRNLVDFHMRLTKIEENSIRDLLVSTGTVGLKLMKLRVSHADLVDASTGAMKTQAALGASLKLI